MIYWILYHIYHNQEAVSAGRWQASHPCAPSWVLWCGKQSGHSSLPSSFWEAPSLLATWDLIFIQDDLAYVVPICWPAGHYASISCMQCNQMTFWPHHPKQMKGSRSSSQGLVVSVPKTACKSPNPGQAGQGTKWMYTRDIPMEIYQAWNI